MIPKSIYTDITYTLILCYTLIHVLSQNQLEYFAMKCVMSCYCARNIANTTHHGGGFTARGPREVVWLRVTVTDGAGIDVDPLKLDVHGRHSHRSVRIKQKNHGGGTLEILSPFLSLSLSD